MEMFHIFTWVVDTWAAITHVMVITFVEIHQTVHLRTDRSANYSLGTKYCLLSVFVNKALFKHSHAYPLRIVYG